MGNKFFFLIASLLLFGCERQNDALKLSFDASHKEQTIHSFGASDCWRTQFIGANWAHEKREKIADLLFSREFDKSGNPLGIGLSMWRFNIGAGSHEAGATSGVDSDWRRTECFLGSNGEWDWTKQKGQRWFLEAARKRGVEYTLGFSIAAPYYMAANSMCRMSDKDALNLNIKDDCYDDYAVFMAEVCKKLDLDYLSPINEPQWDWNGASQEGTSATNRQCYKLIEELDKALEGSSTKVVFGEAGDIRYLYRDSTDRPQRDNQLQEMFNPYSEFSILKFSSVAPVVSGHSYWSTFPVDTMVITRTQLRSAIDELPQRVEYWQSEYCPMEQNEDNPNGGGERDTTMNTALYVARIVHYDLTKANATSWQWWTAFSEWNYKDALIYIDDDISVNGANSLQDELVESCKEDGVFRQSKLLWALGNYSRFVKPGMVRIAGQNPEDGYSLLSSAYICESSGNATVVIVNYSNEPQKVDVSIDNLARKVKSWKMYVTDQNSNLEYVSEVKGAITLPSKSVVTLTTI